MEQPQRTRLASLSIFCKQVASSHKAEILTKQLSWLQPRLSSWGTARAVANRHARIAEERIIVVVSMKHLLSYMEG